MAKQPPPPRGFVQEVPQNLISLLVLS